MIMKNKMYKESGIDTSIDGFKYVGINLTEEQFEELCDLNVVLLNERRNSIPVFNIMLVLKTLGLLPPEMVDNESSNNGNGNSADDFKELFYRKYGKPRDEFLR